jgi:hypothetical protein
LDAVSGLSVQERTFDTKAWIVVNLPATVDDRSSTLPLRGAPGGAIIMG